MKKRNLFGKPYSFLFVCLIAYLGCSGPEKERKKIYHIIGQEETAVADGPIDPSEPPPPTAPFYGPINLILVGESDVYFHRVDQYGYQDSDIVEEVILTKWDVKKISLKQLPEFLATEYEKVKPMRSPEHFTCVKSPSDTILNESFPIIDKFFKTIKFKGYIVRKWTPQEERVIASINDN